MHRIFLALLLFTSVSSLAQTDPTIMKGLIRPIDPALLETRIPHTDRIKCGADRMDVVLSAIKGKTIALVVNQTAKVGKVHLVDSLLSAGVKIKTIFAPEHGFRGTADAGEHVANGIDAKTRIPLISLYGSKKKPSAEDLKDVDLVVFDIQDVGARFYTFLSTLHYLMEACAESNKPLLILDRPNPNGWYVDGPIMKKEYSSFVGVDPLPIVHGLTPGEYAQMVNGEKWLTGGIQCDVQVIACSAYTHYTHYTAPVAPSPNLPNALSVELYPSLCLFEGTNVSVGRGTDAPFQVIGSPETELANAYTFIPESKPGAKIPFLMGKTCYGFDLRKAENRHASGLSWQYLLDMYKLSKDKANFFLKNGFFEKLAGTETIRQMIVDGKNEAEIRQSYQAELDKYKEMRKKYLLYADF